VDRDEPSAHHHFVQPDQVREILAESVHDLDRPLLVLFELINEVDAALKAVLLALIALDFLDDCFETLRFGLLGVDLVALAAELLLLDDPPAATDDDAGDETADDEQIVDIAGGRRANRSYRCHSRDRACPANPPPFPH